MRDSPNLFFLVVTASVLAFYSSVSAQKPTEPSDLISFEDPRSIKISPDGNEVIVRTRKANINNNSYEQSHWRFSVNKKRSLKLDITKDAKSINWFADGKKIAYLSQVNRRNQIWVKEIGSDSARQITKERGGVRDFSLSPDGKSIAYTIIDPRSMSRAKKQSKKRPQQGKEIDLLTFSAYQINNERSSQTRPSFQLQILDLETDNVHQITDSVSVQQFTWSPAGDKIAFTVMKSSMHPTEIPMRASSLFLYNNTTDQTEVIKEGSQKKNLFEDVVSYSTPFWAPSGDKLGYLRTDYSDRWSSVAEVGIYDLQKKSSELFISAEDQEYFNPNFFWVEDDNIFVEFTNEAKRGLFSVSTKDKSLTPVKVSDKANANFSFSSDKNTIAWVSSGVGQFPETFSSDKSFEDARQLSDLNGDLDNLWLPEAKSITWKSKDGTEVQGWYIAPKDKSNDSPVITLLHGGPGIPVLNTFQPYMEQWPYPIQSLAAKGYGIFIPNYRSTSSFGKSFQEPAEPDQEPIEDVITGINYLIQKELANKDKLGIVGHSHGGWLGPMVAAEKPIFKAASFAEGFANYLTLYGQWSGVRNKELHEYNIGSTPYENPDRYVELSPAFQNDFTEQIPTLLEFGQMSPAASQGVELGKALWRHDTPHQLIIYPNEGHSIRSPKMKVDAMKKNIAWFEEWLPVN